MVKPLNLTSIVDAHHHIWDLEAGAYEWLTADSSPYTEIRRSFHPEEFELNLARCGIEGTVVVQADNTLQDTRYLLGQADLHGWIKGVVGWVPLLKSEETEAALEVLMPQHALKGVRHLIHDEPDPHWILQREVIRGLNMLADRHLIYEYIAVYPRHMDDLTTVAGSCPTLTIVLDHLGNPPIGRPEMSDWRRDLRRIASHQNVHAKLSGLNTAMPSDSWTAEDLVEPVLDAIEAFGVERLMYGSNWPVALLAGDYDRVWTETLRVLDMVGLGGGERAAIMGGNAQALYRLGS